MTNQGLIRTQLIRKKSIHHHHGTPPLSVCRPTARSQSKTNGYGADHSLVKTSPVNPHPQNLGGAISPPKFWGCSVRNPLFYSVFWGPPPKIQEVKLSPPRFRGYGLTWRAKGTHRRSGKKGTHHRGQQTPNKKKKEGFHGGGVYHQDFPEELQSLPSRTYPSGPDPL